MANEVLFWHGEKISALAAGRVLAMDNVNGSRAALGTLTEDGSAPTALDTVTVDTSKYTFVTALTEKEATGTLTVTGGGTQIAENDTVTIGGKVYTFHATIGLLDGSVLLGVSDTASLLSLKKAINLTGTATTDYPTAMTANAFVVPTSSDATTLVVTAKALGVVGNGIATTETGAQTSWGHATLTGGLDSIANEVLIGSATASITYLFEAMTAGANVGVHYSTATVAHPTVVATNPTGSTLVATAVAADASGNSIATTETSSHLSWGAAKLVGGVGADSMTDLVTGQLKYETYALVTVTGGNTAFALPVGDEGQEVTLYLKTKGGSSSAVVAGAFVGGTALTFDTAGKAAKLKFLNASWAPIYNTGSIA